MTASPGFALLGLLALGLTGPGCGRPAPVDTPIAAEGVDQDVDYGQLPEWATVTGLVRRSVAPSLDGVGALSVAVFVGNPFEDPEAPALGDVWIDAVDLSADGASAPFTVSVPEFRGEVFVVAALDDDGDGDQEFYEPTAPDLLSLLAADPIRLPSLKLRGPEAHSLDLVLSHRGADVGAAATTAPATAAPPAPTPPARP